MVTYLNHTPSPNIYLLTPINPPPPQVNPPSEPPPLH